jgi:hypothetical protein
VCEPALDEILLDKTVALVLCDSQILAVKRRPLVLKHHLHDVLLLGGLPGGQVLHFVATQVSSLPGLAPIASQLHHRSQEQGFPRVGIPLLDQLGKEVERIYGGANAHNHAALPSK